MISGGNNFNYFPENQLTKFSIFLTVGAYAPYAPCMSTPLEGGKEGREREGEGEEGREKGGKGKRREKGGDGKGFASVEINSWIRP